MADIPGPSEGPDRIRGREAAAATLFAPGELASMRLRPQILAVLRAEAAGTPAPAGFFPAGPATTGARRDAWLAAFPAASPVAVAGAARLFPATSPATFARWLATRSEETAGDPAPSPFRPALEELEAMAALEALEAGRPAPRPGLGGDRADFARVAPGERRLIELVLGFAGAAAVPGDAPGETAASPRGRSRRDLARAGRRDLQAWDVVPAERRPAVRDAARTHPAVGRAADWVRWWAVGDHPVADACVAAAVLEGVLASGAGATLQYYRGRGLFAGIAGLGRAAARDGDVRAAFWCSVLAEGLRVRPAPGVAAAVAAEAVALSDGVFAEAVPAAAVGLREADIALHVRAAADAVLARAGYPPAYGAASPFGAADAPAVDLAGGGP